MRIIIAYCVGVIKGAVLTLIVANSIFFGYSSEYVEDARFERFEICEGFGDVRQYTDGKGPLRK